MILAIIGNFILRRFMKGPERYEPKSSTPTPLIYTQEDIENILKNWAKKDTNYAIPQAYLPLHDSLINVLEQYQNIAFDSTIKVYDRHFTRTPFSENSDFLQIGEWGDGSEILIRLHSHDPNVYIADIEYASPEQPNMLTKSFEEYVILAKQVNDEADKILRKKGDKNH